MPKDPIAKLSFKRANDKDRNISWDNEELCSGPQALLDYIVKHLFVDVGEFAALANIIISPEAPAASDTNKIWAKTSEPYGIGVYDGGWQVNYQYPENVPFLYNTSGGATPSYLDPLSSGDLSNAGLTEPLNDDWIYVMFNPQSYS